MDSKLIIEISSEWEAARLLNLIDTGIDLLHKQGRTQQGIDGFTYSELRSWRDKISNFTGVRCEFAGRNLHK